MSNIKTSQLTYLTNSCVAKPQIPSRGRTYLEQLRLPFNEVY